MIVVDLPGHGETTYLQNHDKPTVESYSEALKEFLEEIDLKEENQIYLIGFVKRNIRLEFIFIFFFKSYLVVVLEELLQRFLLINIRKM